MDKIDIAGLKIDAIHKTELLKLLAGRIENNQKTFITTLYSEFLYAALRDDEIKAMLNSADFAVADGIGIIWAAKFLSLPLTFKNYWLKILQAIWQAKYSVLAILFFPSWIKTIIPEKIVGADLIWDLVKLAKENNLSIYLLGGFGDTPKLVAEKIENSGPNKKTMITHGRELSLSGEKLIAGYSNKNPDDPTIIEDIKQTSADMLFVAFGPIKQEKWIVQNYQNLPVKLAIGLGGSFDYLAGKRVTPPRFLRSIGLEWLWRLITQPYRLKRIFHATFGLIVSLIKYKVFTSLPYRQNVVSVIINQSGQIFLGKFNPNKEILYALGYTSKRYNNYWQFPQGGVNEDENVLETAKRELWEETAMRHLELIKISTQHYSYVWKNMGARPILIKKRYHYKGQDQSIVYFRFTGPEKEIVLDPDEFVEYKWVDPDQITQEIVSEKLTIAKIVQKELSELKLMKTA